MAAPPRFLVWVSVGLVVAGTVMAVVGALRTGVSWDEPFHVMRLRNFFEHGWFSVDWSTETGGSTAGDNNTLVYGPVAMLLLHGLCVLVGVDGWHTVSTTPTAYDVRHLGVVLIGLAGTAAAAGITRVLLGSWRWAVLTAAALLALPMWTGHLMFNVKDVPVATGYTLMTLALVAMVSPAPGRQLLRVAGLVAGITLMVGTRPAMASAVLVAVALLVGGALLARSHGGQRPATGEAVAGATMAGALLAVVYPHVFLHPLLLLGSVRQSASFRDNDASGYTYVPFHLATQFPLLLQALFVVGLWSAVTVIARSRRVDPARATRLALVVAQVTVLPLVAVAKNSDLYNGLRQLLFASPAWAVLVTIGLAHLLAWGALRRRTGLVGGLAAVALLVPMADQATLFPYQYSYFNVAFDATGGHAQTDYWRTSVPELLPGIPTDGQLVCGPTRSTQLGAPAGSPGARGVGAEAMLAGRYSSDSSVDCRTDPLGPLAPVWRADGLPVDDLLPHDEFYVVIDRDHPLPRNCAEIAAVTRHRHWRTVAMTYVARCRLAPQPLVGTVAFTHADGENMLPRLWAYAPEGWVMRESATAIDAAADAASLTFRAPSACAETACALVLDADAPADLGAAVNDMPAAVDVDRGGVSVVLPSGTADTWVTFTSTSGAPLGLRVRSMRAVPSGTG
ncbi:hypothetical protein [Nocardioides conyzicola]|uniref:hypothetical protein n=1 Tax=Nocardioides conyzicola TaxID=1651781 RepID=UPI0031EE43D2